MLTRRRGQAVVLITLSSVLLFAIVGLVVDVGWAYFRAEAARAAVEAGAMAAAAAAASGSGSSFTCGSGNLSCTSIDTPCANPPNSTPPLSTADVACLYAQQNGFANGGTGLGVARHATKVSAAAGTNNQSISYTCGTTSPPPTIPGICVSYWFSMKASEQSAGLFSAVMGHPFMTATRVATAAVVGNGLGGCLYVLNPNASKALMANGGTDLESPCGIWVNSNASDAVFQTSGATINASPGSIQIVGGVKQTGHAVMTPSPITGIAPFSDPMASMKTPAYTSHCDYTNVKMTHSGTLNPGTYCGGISISGGDSNPVVFNPGLYVILGGGISMTGSTGATGTNVTFLLTGNGTYAYQGVDIHGSGTYSFTAPTSGPLESLLFIKDRTQPAALGSTMTGSTSMNMTGIIYLPNESLTFAGGSGVSSAYSIIVCDTFKIAGNAFINSNYSSLAGCVAGPRIARLVQ